MLQNQRIKTIVLSTLLSCIFATTSLAGNLSLIEKRLKELDALNKRIVSETINIPEKGVIQTTIKVPAGNAIKNSIVKNLSIAELSAHSPYTIQVSSSTQHDRILDVAKKLRIAGIPSFVSTVFQHKGKSWWRILIGSYAGKSIADKANNNLQENLLPKGFVTSMPYAIQVGTKMTDAEAATLEKELHKKKYLPYYKQGSTAGATKLLLGAFKTKKDAADAIQNLRPLTASTSVVKR